MSEEQTEYITEALELLQGVTTLEISSPEKVIERRDGQLVEVERSAFVKIYTSFKRELKTLSGDELKVWLYLALSINRYSKAANPGLRKIAEDTGLAVNTVRGIVERLESSHLLDVERAEGRGNQYRPADYASVSKFDTVPQTVSNSEPTVSNSGGTVSTLRGETAQLEELDITRKDSPSLSLQEKEQANRKMDLHLAMMNFPGAKREARISAIQSYLGETFHRNTETKEWLKFAKFIDDKQQNSGEDVKVFVAWLLGQKNYDPQFWPVSKMMEFWPSAFVSVQSSHNVGIDSDGIPETY